VLLYNLPKTVGFFLKLPSVSDNCAVKVLFDWNVILVVKFINIVEPAHNFRIEVIVIPGAVVKLNTLDQFVVYELVLALTRQ